LDEEIQAEAQSRGYGEEDAVKIVRSLPAGAAAAAGRVVRSASEPHKSIVCPDEAHYDGRRMIATRRGSQSDADD
jgi:hypothetical protein